ncbi:MAG: sugar phosphate isomerase/epimerase [Pirellulales bacterium]|nr:sugar phosphate isomerase/epimerase [Pirellulales bacterium]
MTNDIRRRDFLLASAATIAASGMMGSQTVSAAETPKFKTTLHKARIGAPSEATLKSWTTAGFEGMETNGKECWSKSPTEAAKDHLTAEKLGMRIHSVLFGWANFNSPDAGKVAADVENVKAALRAAQGYGADAVLLVPCRIGGMPIPNAWEFDIKFDEKTGHIKEVVKGDNSQFAKYVEAHNVSTDATRKAVAKLIPVAQETGVTIALENVWNNLWVKPEIFKNLVASFNTRWVAAYYDIGNHVKYAPPQDWIRTLGDLIVKCHVKDFKLKPNGQGGSFADFRDGSIDWPAVRKALDDIGYSGWMTIEGSGGLSLAEQSKRLDLIFAGK